MSHVHKELINIKLCNKLMSVHRLTSVKWLWKSVSLWKEITTGHTHYLPPVPPSTEEFLIAVTVVSEEGVVYGHIRESGN